MFGIGFTELIIIVVLTLMVLGPERLPELAGKLGSTVRDLRRMYANLRAELGSDFDEIEQSIRDLRSLDPRQQLRDYGRDLLNEVTTEAPELKQLAAAPKLDVERLGRQVLRDELLDKPLAERAAAKAAAATSTQAAGSEDELLEALLTTNEAAPAAQSVPSNGKHPVLAPSGTTHAANSPNGAVEHAPTASAPVRRARTYSQPVGSTEISDPAPTATAPARRARAYSQPPGPDHTEVIKQQPVAGNNGHAGTVVDKYATRPLKLPE